MDKRPLSLTIIAWWLVIGGIIGIISVLSIGSNQLAVSMLEKSGVPMSVYQANGVIGCVVGLVSAYGIFKGLPWSRVLYLGWSLLGIIFTLAVMPIISIIAMSVIFWVIIAFFLFRQAANDWFAARGLSLQRQG